MKLPGLSNRASKRVRRELGRLKGEAIEHEFMSRRRAIFAEDDHRITNAITESRECDHRALEALAEMGERK